MDVIQAPTGAPDDDGFLLTFQNGLTKQMSQHEYDVVVCATGYDTSSWLQLLRRSELGKHFVHGDSSSGAPVLILPHHGQRSDSHTPLPSDLSVEASGMKDGSTSTPSTVNTPPTSLETTSPVSGGHLGYCGVTPDTPPKVYVTRAYQLVPQDPGMEPLPRIYVQGCTESTHGLGDTLLSLISIKAGEIVAELIRA